MKLMAIILLVLTIALLGCGGSGSVAQLQQQQQQSSAGQAQGLYSGTTSTGAAFSALVLPSDYLYVLYGSETASTFYVAGMMAGQGSSNNSKYTASLTDYYWTGQTYSASVNGAYSPGASLSGTVTETSVGTYTFTAAPLVASNYTYNTQAQLSQIVGTWNGMLLDGTLASVTINSNGTFTGSNLGCIFTGNISPDSSGKNFFTMSLTFGSSICVLPGKTATGVGLTYLLPNGTKRQLVFAGTSSGQGTVFMATK